MKQTLTWLLAILLLVVPDLTAFAQILSVGDFKIDDAAAVTFYSSVNEVPCTYSVKVRRDPAAGNSTNALLTMYIDDDITNGGQPELFVSSDVFDVSTSSGSATPWQVDTDGKQYSIVKGDFMLRSSAVQGGVYTRLQFKGTYNNNNVFFSNYVAINYSNSPPPLPNITSLSPSSGAEGTTVAVTGTDLRRVNTVSFNGTSATPLTTPTPTNTSFSVRVPVGATTGLVTATRWSGTGSGVTFTVTNPTINSVSPSSGPIGTSVVITGANFTGTTAVRFNGLNAPSFVVNSSTQITVQVPAGASTGSLTVTTPIGTSGGPTFFITGPLISNLSPYEGPVGTVVTLTGTGFINVTNVQFNGLAAANFFVISSTTIEATVPAGATSGDATVISTGGNSNGKYFMVAVPPTITSLSLNNGPVSTSVQVNGTNFTSASVVKFNGVRASSFLITTSILFTSVPTGATSGDVTVTTAGGVSNGTFFSVTGAPLLTGISPNAAQTGTTITLSGNDLGNAISVTFGGGVSVAPSSTSANSLTVVVPSTARTGAVTVTNPSGTSNGYSFIAYINFPAGLYSMKNTNSNHYLEIGGIIPAPIVVGSSANQWYYVGTANQQWNFVSAGDGKYRIFSRNSGYALQTRGSGSDPYQAGAAAEQGAYTASLQQQWYVSPGSASGSYNLVNALSRFVLEIGGAFSQAGAGANQWYLNPNVTAQEWQMVPIPVPASSALFPGVYRIRNLNSQSKFLGIAQGSPDYGASAQQAYSTFMANQEWTFVETNGGYYQIINRNSNKVLDVANFSNADGAPVHQWEYIGGYNQQWAVQPLSDGSYRFTSRNSTTNQVLDVEAHSTYQDAAIVQASWSDHPSQHWYIEASSDQSRGVSFSAKGTSQPMQVVTGARAPAKNAQLSLYPNPASTTLHLALSGNAVISSVQVTDLRGAVISTARYQSGDWVDISSLAAGTYLLTATAGKQVYHQKFIKD